MAIDRAQMKNDEQDIRLTKLDRTILIHLLKIRSALEGKNDYERQVTILREGYSLYYREALETVGEDDVSMAGCRFVLSVLQMYRAIERYKSEAGDTLEGDELSHFAGFDGTHETDLMGFARFEIERRGYWDEHKPHARSTDDFNSHTPMRATYEAMLQVFDSLPSSGRVHLSKPDVKRILDAGRSAARSRSDAPPLMRKGPVNMALARHDLGGACPRQTGAHQHAGARHSAGHRHDEDARRARVQRPGAQDDCDPATRPVRGDGRGRRGLVGGDDSRAAQVSARRPTHAFQARSHPALGSHTLGTSPTPEKSPRACQAP